MKTNPPGHLLMIVHRIPYPPDKGDKIRSFHELVYFKEKGWKIHLCTFMDDPEDRQHISSLKKYCETLAVFNLPAFRQKLSMARAFLQKKPLSVGAFYHFKAQKYVDNILANYPVQAFFCFCAPMAEYLFCSKFKPLEKADKSLSRAASQTFFMDFVDVDSEKWALYAQNNTGAKSWIYNLENKLLSKYEQKVAIYFDGVSVVSRSEAELLSKMNGQLAKVYAFGNGVDLNYFKPQQSLGKSTEHSKTCKLVFCGQMDYYPNIDAMLWFAEEVLPKLKAHLPALQLTIVGSRPTRDIQKMAQDHEIQVTGRVKDVRPYLNQAHISIAPIRIARGVQNKVLEAMAMAKPVVATEQAFEGIDAKANQDLLVTQAEPETFAQAISELFKDPLQASRMAVSARQRIEKHYSWETRLAPLGEFFQH